MGDARLETRIEMGVASRLLNKAEGRRAFANREACQHAGFFRICYGKHELAV